jgi:hypothetical protein
MLGGNAYEYDKTKNFSHHATYAMKRFQIVVLCAFFDLESSAVNTADALPPVEIVFVVNARIFFTLNEIKRVFDRDAVTVIYEQMLGGRL